jgi:hypothetical protein
LDAGKLILLLFFVAIAGLVFFQLFTRRGREWMLGGRIGRTYGTPIVLRRGMTTTTIRIHSVEAKHLGDSPRVGIEIANRAALAASTTPLTLSQDDARALGDALKEASEYRGAVS